MKYLKSYFEAFWVYYLQVFHPSKGKINSSIDLQQGRVENLRKLVFSPFSNHSMHCTGLNPWPLRNFTLEILDSKILVKLSESLDTLYLHYSAWLLNVIFIPVAVFVRSILRVHEELDSNEGLEFDNIFKYPFRIMVSFFWLEFCIIFSNHSIAKGLKKKCLG